MTQYAPMESVPIGKSTSTTSPRLTEMLPHSSAASLVEALLLKLNFRELSSHFLYNVFSMGYLHDQPLLSS